MKTIQLELSDSIYDRVISFLELLPQSECHILENLNSQQEALKEALDNAVASNRLCRHRRSSRMAARNPSRSSTTRQRCMILLDSNILIYLVQKEYETLRQWLLSIHPAYSVISKVEVLGYWNLSPTQAQAIAAVLSLMREISLTTSQCDQAISLRQQRKMSLGDALIAATALDHNLTLATRNTKDLNGSPDCNLLTLWMPDRSMNTNPLKKFAPQACRDR